MEPLASAESSQLGISGNPVVNALEAYLLASGIPFICQSGTAEEDITALIDSKHMVYGVGTFGTAICMFSEPIESVFYFSPDKHCPFATLPNIAKIVHISDSAGGYIKAGDWKNTPEQRATMVDYPIEKLAIIGEWIHPVNSDASKSAKSPWDVFPLLRDLFKVNSRRS